MQCSECGTEADPDATFCSNCGRKLGASTESIEQIVRDLNPRETVTLVRKIWSERGWKTKPVKHDGSTYVLAKHPAEGTREVVQVGAGTAFSEQAAADLASLRDEKGFDGAYFVSTDDSGSVAVDGGDVERLDSQTIVATVRRLNLGGFVSSRFSDAPATDGSEESETATGGDDASADSVSSSPDEPPVDEQTQNAERGGENRPEEDAGSAVSDERVARIVSQAAGDSVTEERLRETGSATRFTSANLGDAPLVAYLDPEENPQFVFQNETKGVSIDGAGAIQPSEDYRALIAITDQRVLCVVGQDDGDSVVSIPYEAVQSVESMTGFFKHRLTVSAGGRDIDLFVATGAVEDEDEVGEAEEFISARIDQDAEASTGVVVDGTPLGSVPADEFEDEATALEMVGAVAVLLVGGVVVLALVGGTIGVLTSSGGDSPAESESQLVEQAPEDVVLGLQQLGSGWKRHPDGPRAYVLDAADRDASATYLKSDESYQFIGATGTVSEVALLDNTTGASELYTSEVAAVKDEYAVNDVGVGDAAILYEDGNSVYVLFQYRNLVGAITYQEPVSGFGQKRKAKQFARKVIENTG